MKSSSGEELISLGITDRISVLVVARTMETKHNMLQNELTRISIIQQGVENFNKLFQPLFQKGFPKFLGPEGKLIPQRKYVDLLQEEILNHANFEGMNGGIKEQVIIDKIGEEFELLETLMTVKSDLPSIGHSPLIDLDLILKDIFEMATPTDH